MKRWLWVGVGCCGLMGVAWAQDTLYHCKAYSGGLFWSRQHCQQREALVVRMVNVPSGLAWSEQVRLAEQASHGMTQAAARSKRAAEMEERAARQQARVQLGHERRCAEFQQALDHQDSLARWGGSARKLARIAARKQTLQERRQQQGC